MRITRKITIFALLIIVLITSIIPATAASALSKEEAYDSVHWQPIHRWDFNGDLEDSIGGAVAVATESKYFQEPEFSRGRIITGIFF